MAGYEIQRYGLIMPSLYVKDFSGVNSRNAEGATSEPMGPMPRPCAPKKTSHFVVGGAHAFVLRISSFFGLAPLRFESRGNGFAVSLSSAMCIYSYILVTVLAIATISNLVAELYVGVSLSVQMYSTMLQVVSACDILVVVVIAGAGVYGAPKRMRNMLKFMDSVSSVDSCIGGQYSAAKERKLCAVFLSILIFFSVVIMNNMCYYAIQTKRNDRQWAGYIAFYLLWYVVMILELQFAFTALSIRARFQAVNDALALTAKNMSVSVEQTKSVAELNIFAIRVAPSDTQRANVSLLMETLPGSEPVIVRKSVNGEPRLLVSPSEAIHRLSSLYGALCDVVRHIDASYGVPLIVILISTLLHLIVTPYYLIMDIIVSIKTEQNRAHFLVLYFLWFATHMMRLFGVVEPCHYTIFESKRTEGLVCRLMMSATSAGTLTSRLEVFSRQLMLQPVSYTPMGMCTLDRPLIASILGAVTTYLVILVQFQRSDS